MSLITALRPYCTVGLSNLQSCALMAQFITLFGGILLIIDKYLSEEAQNAGESVSPVQRNLIAYSIYAANLAVMVWPFLQMVFLGQFAETIDKVNKILWVFKKEKPVLLERTDEVPTFTPVSLAHHFAKIPISSQKDPNTEETINVNQTRTSLGQTLTSGEFQNSEFSSVDSISSFEIHAEICVDV
jgi:hypothetical protein